MNEEEEEEEEGAENVLLVGPERFESFLSFRRCCCCKNSAKFKLMAMEKSSLVVWMYRPDCDVCVWLLSLDQDRADRAQWYCVYV